MLEIWGTPMEMSAYWGQQERVMYMSKISLGKFKDVPDSLVGYIPLKGKGFSLDWGRALPAFHRPIFLIFQLRGKGRREAGQVP